MSDYMRNRKSLSSVADAYGTMYTNKWRYSKWGVDWLSSKMDYDEEIGEWLDYLDEVNSVMSVDKE